MASQGSVEMTDSQADRLLGIDNGDSQDAGVMPPPISKEPTPDWLDKKNHPAAFPQAGSLAPTPRVGAVAAKPLKPALQPSGTSQLGAQIRGMQVGEPAAAPVPSGSRSTGTVIQKSGASESSTLGEVGDSEEDDPEPDLTPEQQARNDHVNKVESVIAAAKKAGCTFSEKTGWMAAEAYVNNKQLFDDAGEDITSCANRKSEINFKQVDNKLAELREAARAAVVHYQAGGLSQEPLGEEEEEEEEEEVENESDDEYKNLSKQTLESKKEQFEVDLAIAEAKADESPNSKYGGPVKIAFREFNKELLTYKNSSVYEDKVR